MLSLTAVRTAPSLSSTLPYLIPRLTSLSRRQMTTWSLTRSLDRYLDEQYSPIGHVRQLPDGVQFYSSGNTESHKAVIIISDMFGWKTGRIRNYADFFCELGYYVIIPRMLTISHPNEESTHHEDEERGGLPSITIVTIPT